MDTAPAVPAPAVPAVPAPAVPAVPAVPTRADHAWEARLLAARACIPEWLQGEFVARAVEARARERHNARVEFLRSQLQAHADATGLSVRALARLVLAGWGGPGDAGGPGGASALPIVRMPDGAPIRRRARTGGAWVAALEELARVDEFYEVGVWVSGDVVCVELADGEFVYLGADGPVGSDGKRIPPEWAAQVGRLLSGRQLVSDLWIRVEVALDGDDVAKAALVHSAATRLLPREAT